MGSSRQIATFLFLFFTLQFAFSEAHAQVKITSISGASNFIASNGTSNPIIYGGIAGLEADCGTTSSTSTCNNCSATVNKACNTRRIHTGLTLRINFTVTGDLTGSARLTYGTALATANSQTASAPSFTKGNSGYIEVPWSSLCVDLGSPSCNTVVSVTVQISVGAVEPPAAGSYSSATVKIFRPEDSTNGVDTIECGLSPEQDGICAFTAFPGDEKIYMSNLDDEGSYPTADNVPFLFLRVFNSSDAVLGFNDINYGTSNLSGRFVDLDIDNDGAVSPEKIEGLTNETGYYFKTAMVDAAYNIAYLTSNTEILKTCSALVAPATGCNFFATPSNVLGLLEKDFNCFITTAAYGSSMSAKVQDFRAFRNHFLIPYDWGRSVIFYYYNVGPKAARWMWQHPWSRPVVRAALWPVWLYAVIANGAGIFIANFTFFLVFALVAYSIYALRTRQSPAKVRRREK